LSAARYVTGTRRAYGGLGTGRLVEDVPVRIEAMLGPWPPVCQPRSPS